jgi:hypothetical protein
VYRLPSGVRVTKLAVFAVGSVDCEDDGVVEDAWESDEGNVEFCAKAIDVKEERNKRPRRR